jgi:hypothetical protein
MADTPARILIGDVNQFLYGVGAIADYMRGDTFRNSHDLTVDDQNPVVLAGDETLDLNYSISTFAFCERVERPDFFVTLEINADSTAVIAIKRFDDHRISNAIGGSDCVVCIPYHLTSGNGYAHFLKQSISQFLVRCNIDGNV